MVKFAYAFNFCKPFFDSLKNYQPNLHSSLSATQPPPPLLSLVSDSQPPPITITIFKSNFFFFFLLYMYSKDDKIWESNRKYTLHCIFKNVAKQLKIISFSKIIFRRTKHSLWLYNIYDRKLRNFEIIWFNLLYS